MKRCGLFEMGRKRGQFFIFAAVFLSVLLFSMAFTVNQVRANEPDLRFKNYADDVRRESDYVLDYEVYNDISSEKVDDFVSILENDFHDREPAANFLLIYGNSSFMKIKNLGTEGINVSGGGDSKKLSGSDDLLSSKIRVAGFTSLNVEHYNSNSEIVLKDVDDSIDIEFNDDKYSFPVSGVNQIIFIIQKEIDDETFVEVR